MSVVILFLFDWECLFDQENAILFFSKFKFRNLNKINEVTVLNKYTN